MEVAKELIEKSLADIEEELYSAAIVELIHRKSRSVKSSNIFEARHKISKFLISKGFEPDLVWQLLKEEMPD